MKTNYAKTMMISLVLISSIGLVSCSNRQQTENQTREKVKVKLAQARLREYPVEFSFSGKLESGKQANLSTRIMGQIEQIYVQPGQRVSKGQVLLRIRNQDIMAKKAQVEATLTEARSAYENAEKDLKRFEALYQSQSTSEKEMDDIRTRFQMAKARLTATEQMQHEVNENLQYTTIRAPYAGIITGKFVQKGDMANPGMPLLSVESPDQWQVVARIPEEDISRVKLNEPVKVRLHALENLTIEGTIAEINPSAVHTGPQFEAKVLLSAVPRYAAGLYTGTYATVDYKKGSQPLLLIPGNSLIKRGQLTGLYTVSQEGTALLRWIRTGKTYGDSIEVLSGLADGEQYILSAENRIYDGTPVQNN